MRTGFEVTLPAQAEAKFSLFSPQAAESSELSLVNFARDSLTTLVGTVDQMCDDIEGWRERWGISYLTWSADAVETMAPVVERLAGR